MVPLGAWAGLFLGVGGSRFQKRDKVGPYLFGFGAESGFHVPVRTTNGGRGPPPKSGITFNPMHSNRVWRWLHGVRPGRDSRGDGAISFDGGDARKGPGGGASWAGPVAARSGLSFGGPGAGSHFDQNFFLGRGHGQHNFSWIFFFTMAGILGRFPGSADGGEFPVGGGGAAARLGRLGGPGTLGLSGNTGKKT